MSRPTVIVRSAVIGAGVCYSVLLSLSDLELDTFAKRSVSLLPIVGTGILAAFDLLLWRTPLLRWVHHRSRLDGLWKLTLEPSAESQIPSGGNRGLVDAYLEITQSFWSIHVRQLTAESSSRSQAFSWGRSGGEMIEQLTFLYENDPKVAHQPRSMRHMGACTLQAARREPDRLVGKYFTDRYTAGDMTCVLVDRTRGYATFAEAETHAGAVR